MSETPYLLGRGAPPQEVAPTEGINVQRNIRATPEAFGAGSALGLQQAGQAIQQMGPRVQNLGQVWGKVQTDDQLNSAFEMAEKAKGDFFAKEGRDAVAAKPEFDKQIEEIRKNYSSGLTTSEQQTEFDNAWRRFHVVNIMGPADTHYNQQALKSASEVNDSTVKNSFTSIASSPDDDEIFTQNLESAKHAAAKNIDLHGGGEEARTAALNAMTAGAWKTRIESIGVKDPVRALQMVEAHKADLGAHVGTNGQVVNYYDQLSEHLRSHADQQAGNSAGHAALTVAHDTHVQGNPSLPVYTQAAQSTPGFSSPSGIARTVYIESRGNPNAGAGTSHVGAGQFSVGTAKAVGISDRSDFTQNVYGIQKYAAMNRPVLAKTLGRDPTDAELYLAHQQGPAGASKLLANPNARAGDLVGDAAIRGNGGDPNAPASAFTAKWIAKFNGTPFVSPGPSIATFKPSQPITPGSLPVIEPGPEPVGEQPVTQAQAQEQDIFPAHAENVKADAYKAVLDDPNLSEGARQHALHYINQRLQAEDIAYNQSEKARKEANDAAAQEIVQAALQGNFDGLSDQIATDKRLNWQTRQHLGSYVQAEAKRKATREDEGYGSGYADLYRRVVAPPGDPQRIADPGEIYRMAGEGGPLTGNGAAKLVGVMQTIKRPETQSAHLVFAQMMREIKKEASFEIDDGFVKIPDPVGEKNFAYSIFPALQTQFDKVLAEGGDLQKFYKDLPQTARDLRDQLRPPAQMARERMAALGATGGGGENQSVPPPPQGVEPKNWQTIVVAAPSAPNGKPYRTDVWGRALSQLASNPTAETVRAFNASVFGKSQKAEDLLRQLGIAVREGM